MPCGLRSTLRIRIDWKRWSTHVFKGIDVSLLGATYPRTGRCLPWAMPFRVERASPRTRCVRKLLGDVRSFFRSFRAHFTLGEHIPWDISCYHRMCLEPWKNYSRRRNPVWPCHITAEGESMTANIAGHESSTLAT